MYVSKKGSREEVQLLQPDSVHQRADFAVLWWPRIELNNNKYYLNWCLITNVESMVRWTIDFPSEIAILMELVYLSSTSLHTDGVLGLFEAMWPATSVYGIWVGQRRVIVPYVEICPN